MDISPFRLELITAPTSEPITTTDLQTNDYLRGIDFSISTETALFTDVLIPSCRYVVETYLRRALISQTWEISLDCMPEKLDLPLGNLISVDSIKVIAADGTATSESTDKYSVRTGDRGFFFLNDSYQWTTTTRPYDIFRIRYTCGWANAAAVPKNIKHALMLTVAHAYENREGTFDIPNMAKQLLSSQRILRL